MLSGLCSREGGCKQIIEAGHASSPAMFVPFHPVHSCGPCEWILLLMVKKSSHQLQAYVFNIASERAMALPSPKLHSTPAEVVLQWLLVHCPLYCPTIMLQATCRSLHPHFICTCLSSSQLTPNRTCPGITEIRGKENVWRGLHSLAEAGSRLPN